MKGILLKFRWAALCGICLLTVASLLFLYENFHYGRLNPFENIDLQNILMAKTDRAGDTYIIDNGRSRIVKMDKDGRVDWEINGGNDNDVFYNVYDIAVEDEKSFFVHEIAWDESGMSLAAERILEFDKGSGALRRELHRLGRSGHGLDRKLSALIALNDLRFEAGKLWFVRKSEDFFSLCSLVPGEKIVTEYNVNYEDALRTLDDFAIDIAGRRIFFLDKGGVLRVFDSPEMKNPEMENEVKNKMKVVFNPVSGVSAREFSFPYRLAFDGTSLYFSDTGKRAILRLESDNRAKIVFGGWDKGEPPLYYFVHSRGDLLTLAGETSIVGLSPDGEEIFRVSSLPVEYRIVLRRICLWISAFVLLSSLLFVAAAAFRFLSSGKMSSKELLSFAIALGMAAAFIAVAPTIIDALRTTAKDEIMNRLSYVMEISSKILDVGALAEIKTPQDYNGPAYKRFTRSLDDLLEKENEWNRQIYCDVFKFKDGIRYSVCFMDGTIGAFFNPAIDPAIDSTADPTNSNTQSVGASGEWVRNMDYQNISGSYMSLSGPIHNPDGSVGGEIEIGVDLRALENSIRALSRSALVRILLILAFLLFIASEILESIPFTKIRPIEKDEEIPLICFRPLTFVVFLAFNLSTGFLPNYALKIGGSFMGLSSEISAVLPITVGDVMLTLAPLMLPSLIALTGRYLSFLAGFVLCLAGYAISAAATAIGPLIVGMGALGLGAGTLFTLMQTCIALREDAQEKALAFSSFAAASFSGVNCGIMTGGIIATNFGQKTVFSFGVFLWIAVMAAFLLVTRKNKGAWSRTGANTGKPDTGKPNAEKPVRPSREIPGRIAAFLLLTFFPFTLYSGFIYYLVPVLGSREGFSDTEISLVFVFFGVGILFLGPRIVAFTRGATNKISHLLRLALVIELAGILCFASFQSVVAMLTAVFVLGGAFGIGNVYFPLALTEMPEAKKLGEAGDMALFNFTENLGFAAGPMIFSAILHSENPFWYYVLAALTLLASLAYHFAHRGAAEVHQ